LFLHHSLVAFGVWAFELGSLSHVHTSSAVQVHGHDAEQLFGGFAHDWYRSDVPSTVAGPWPDWSTHHRMGCPAEHPV
jgi:hypothetical protein